MPGVSTGQTTSGPTADAAGARRRLTVAAADVAVSPAKGFELRRPTDLRSALLRPAGVRLVRRYEESRWVVHDLDRFPRPFLTTAMLKLLTRKQAEVADLMGRSARVTWSTVLTKGAHAAADLVQGRRLLREFDRLLATVVQPGPRRRLPDDGHALYLWTDIVPGLIAGGAVSHAAGVLNNLGRTLRTPILVTSQRLPLVNADIECHEVAPSRRHWDQPELVPVAYNTAVLDALPNVLGRRRPSLFYQRYARWNIAGLAAARRAGVPFVLEYNGSELWMASNWGNPIRRLDVARRVEDAVVTNADLVVVVSAALQAELVGRGVPLERILVNPNGVDPERFSPDVDGRPVRARHGLKGRRVVGFIGTFGPWHGAETLARAALALLDRRPDLRSDVSFLFIGDGPRRAATEALVAAGRDHESFVFTGLVPQDQGPSHLAACDVLVAPHVPNPDGTPFFGSPTKLFEYMATGRGIVASDLEQIGQVLEHDGTAWLVPPGDCPALAGAIELLLDRPDLRDRLGRTARHVAVARHTWAAHTDRIVEAVRAIR